MLRLRLHRPVRQPEFRGAGRRNAGNGIQRLQPAGGQGQGAGQGRHHRRHHRGEPRFPRRRYWAGSRFFQRRGERDAGCGRRRVKKQTALKSPSPFREDAQKSMCPCTSRRALGLRRGVPDPGGGGAGGRSARGCSEAALYTPLLLSSLLPSSPPARTTRTRL
jgi:hypothetical protein